MSKLILDPFLDRIYQDVKLSSCFIIFYLFLLISIVKMSPDGWVAPVGKDPVLGPRDIIEIMVFDEPSLSMTVVISASGEIPFPLLKRVKAGGKTADELSRHMEERLLKEKFLANPSVNVIVKDQRSAVVTVTGAVKIPGVVSIYPGMQVQELIAKQGGVLPELAGPFINIQRATGEMLKIERKALAHSSASTPAEGNLELQPGDLIIIPEADSFYVLGAVTTPGGIPYTKRVNLGEALGMAGGRKANAGNTLLWYHNPPNEDPKLLTFTYHQYEKDPVVRQAEVLPGDSLHVTQNDSVFVGGDVTHPGTHPWSPGMTLLSAVVAAGDRTVTGANTVRLYRADENGRQVLTEHSYGNLKKGKGGLEVLPGDVIVVTSNILKIPLTLRQVNPFSLPVSLFNPLFN